MTARARLLKVASEYHKLVERADAVRKEIDRLEDGSAVAANEAVSRGWCSKMTNFVLDRPRCPECGHQMSIMRKSPVGQCTEHRVYGCQKCKRTISILAAIEPWRIDSPAWRATPSTVSSKGISEVGEANEREQAVD